MGISTRFCKHFNLTPDIGQGSDTGLGTSHTPYIMWCVHTKLTVQCDPLPVVTSPLSILSDIMTSHQETNISPREAGHTPGLWSAGCSPPDVRSLVLMTESHDMVTLSHTWDVMGHWALTSVSPQPSHPRIIKILILGYRRSQNGSVS